MPKAYRARVNAERRLREAAGTGIIWAGMAAAMAVIVAAAVVFRVDLVRIWPRTAGAFASVGLPVNHVGLVIEGLKAEPSLQDGHAALTISGVLRNIEDHTVEAPPLRLSLLNPAGKRVAGKIAAAADPLVRQVVREAAPQAREVISYRMPALRQHGPQVLGYELGTLRRVQPHAGVVVGFEVRLVLQRQRAAIRGKITCRQRAAAYQTQLARRRGRAALRRRPVRLGAAAVGAHRHGARADRDRASPLRRCALDLPVQALHPLVDNAVHHARGAVAVSLAAPPPHDFAEAARRVSRLQTELAEAIGRNHADAAAARATRMANRQQGQNLLPSQSHARRFVAVLRQYRTTCNRGANLRDQSWRVALVRGDRVEAASKQLGHGDRICWQGPASWCR